MPNQTNTEKFNIQHFIFFFYAGVFLHCAVSVRILAVKYSAHTHKGAGICIFLTHILEILIMHANTHPHVQTHTSERPASSPTPVGIWQVLYIWVAPLP